MTGRCPLALALAALVAGFATPADARTVALFEDPAFVDTGSGSVAAEADNVRASLESLGHEVLGYTGTSAVDVAAALADIDVAVIPELELGDLAGALGEPARQAYRQHVESGGGLIVMATSGAEAARLLNALFGWTLTTGALGTGMLTTAALPTAFGDGPATVAENSRSRGIDLSSLPVDALPAYLSGSRANVARLLHGAGRVIYLGWDWFDAAPAGSQDGGWIEVLDRGVLEAGACRDTGAGDLDGDGIADACDAVAELCADVDGERTLAVAPRVVVRGLGAGGVAGGNGLAISGEFRLPPDRVFASLDPQATPLIVALADASGAVRFSVALPTGSYGGAGTVGWRRSRGGRKWTFVDETATPVGGIVAAFLRDRSAKQPRRVRLAVTGRGGRYPLDGGDAPLIATVVVGEAVAGECAHTDFRPGDCKVGRRGRRLKCGRS